MTEEKFYKFALMMKKNSNILFSNDRNHTSVYLAGYVLEAYVKILLIINGANTHRGNNENSYGGHINNANFINRLSNINPEMFRNSILHGNNNDYPKYLLNGDNDEYTEAKWNINYRYEINRWTDRTFANNIQNEINIIQQVLVQLRIDGIIGLNNDSN